MIQIPRNKVAVIPVFDSQESKGGIIKPSSFVYKRDIIVYSIYGENGKLLDQTDDKEHVDSIRYKYTKQGINTYVKQEKKTIEDQPLDAGERCDQGVIKYIGPEVKDVRIGDYVFFSGYTGTLMYIEGEGKLIILPENFIECIFNIERFTHIPGLYFKDKDNRHFPATYEQAMNIISEAFTDLGLTIEVKGEMPKYEDYNKR